MATLTKTIAAPASNITIPDDAAIVHIGVRQVNGRYTLGVFPSRRGDTMAFYSDDPALRSAERPRQVVWVAHELPNKMELVIEAKPKVQGLGLLQQNLYTITTLVPNSEAHNTSTYGVLKLTLGSGTYSWQFIPIAGQTFTDAGTGTCR